MKCDLTPWTPRQYALYLEGSDVWTFMNRTPNETRQMVVGADAAIRKAAYSSWRAHIETKR